MIQDIETKALRYYEVSERMKLNDEEREKIKSELGNLLEAYGQNEVRVRLNELQDLKVKLATRNAKKVDKPELAEALGVSESAINVEFLLKAVEDGRLTLHQYKQYMFQEENDVVSVRKVNA